MTRRSPAPRTVPAYAFAHYGKSLFWEMSELLFAFYLAEIFGVEPAVLGVLLFVFLIWDAATDPILGAAIGNRQASIALLVKLQLFGAVISSVSFFAVFHKPDADGSLLIFYALAVGLMFRTAYTIYDVPQNTLLRRLTFSPDSRLTVASLRIGVSAVASLTIGAAAAFILAQGGIDDQAAAFTMAAGVFCFIAVASALLLFVLTRNREKSEQQNVRLPAGSLRDTFKRPDLRTIFFARFCLSVGSPIFGRLLPFFAVYILFSPTMAGLFVTAMALAELCAQPLLTWYGRAVSRRVFAGTIAALSVFVSIGFFLFAQASLIAAMIFVFLRAAAFCALNLLTWTRLADILAEPDKPPANDVLAFGVFTFSSKLGLGVGGLFLGGVLIVAGYERGGELSDLGKWIFLGAMSFTPMISALVAVWLMFSSEQKHAA